MKSVSDEFDVFDASSPRFVDVANVLASNARLTDLLEVLQRERDQLDLLLDVTNAVVTQLDTRDLFRAVAPALRRCCSADVAALSVYDAEAGVLRHHVCDAPEGFGTASDVPTAVGEHDRRIRHGPRLQDGRAAGVLRVGAGRVSRERLHPVARYPLCLRGAACDGARRHRHPEPRGVRRGCVLARGSSRS